ncbi:MAG: Rieske 2Fe-2S domain-containing protein [Rhodobacteraceae bacterium]|nr:Rieske 2Fe-2S domain-containing protein [Paracoccaceae bacterium]
MTTTARLCAKSEVEHEEPLKVEAAGLTLAVYRVADEFYVTDDACTHGPGSLSEGFQEGHIIECDFHGGCFDIRDGSVTAPPCMEPVKTYRLVRDDTAVVIEIE